MQQDITALRNALSQLETMLRFYDSAIAKNDAESAIVGRTAIIQAFEFSFILSIKTLRRSLELIAPEQGVNAEMDYRTVLLIAKDFGLIQDADSWIKYRDNRNKTSHTYNEDRAINVLKVVPQFFKDSQHMLEIIETKIRSFNDPRT